MRWKFSHLKNTSAPLRAFTVRDVSTGVRRAWPAMRAAAASTSAYVTGSGCAGAFMPRFNPPAAGAASPASLVVERSIREVAGVGPRFDRPPPEVDPDAVHRGVGHAERARHLERDAVRVAVDDPEHAAVADHRDRGTGVGAREILERGHHPVAELRAALAAGHDVLGIARREAG